MVNEPIFFTNLITHILLKQLNLPSIRKPASFSSGLTNSDKGGKDVHLRKSNLSLRGENDNAGSGGASTIYLISGGGSQYPMRNSDSTSHLNKTCY